MQKRRSEVVREVMNKLDLADMLCREEVRRMARSGEIDAESDSGVVVSVVMEKVAKLFGGGSIFK